MDYTRESLFSLKDKVAVVLGGTSGIGQAISYGFARFGAVVVPASRDRAKVDGTVAEIEKLGGRAMAATADVQDRDSLEALCAATTDRFGRVDVLVVTSGVLQKAPTADVSEEDWTRVIDANLNGTFRANQIFGRKMLGRKSGSIINTCSMTTFVSFNEVTAYGASKAGVGQLTRQLACEWARDNVRVNAIAPGVVRTPLNTRALDIPERAAAILGRTPMGRFGHVNELVGAAIFLASDASTFVTGQILAVDGGFLAKGI